MHPAVSRDGRIVFLSTRDGPADLYVMDGRGGNVHRLTTSPFADGGKVGWNDAGVTRASWAPSGEQIAFDVQHLLPPQECFSNCVIWRIYVSSPDGSGLRAIGDYDGRDPAWSADGRSIAYENVADAYGDIEGTTITRLDGRRTVHLGGANPDEVGPVWSPKADELAYQVRPYGKLPWIYVVRADGSQRRRLAQGQRPVWSPDGRRIAFLRNSRLVVIGKDGKGRRAVSPRGVPVDAASWSPNGKLFAIVVGGTVETLSVDGRHEREIYSGSVSDLWGVTAPAWTPDSKRVVVETG